MTAAPLRIIVDELLTTIKQTFADRSVSRAQAAYCVITVANTLKSQHIAKRDSGAFLGVFPDIPIQESGTNVFPNVVKNRKYIELPGLIFDFDKDGAVEYLAYESLGLKYEKPQFTRVKILRTSPAEMEWLELHPNTKASPKEPYFYRVGNLLYLFGLEKVPVKKLEAGLYLTINPLTSIDIDQPFDFPEELISVLKRQVVDLIRFSWFFKSDRDNTGNDESGDSKTNFPKIASVNTNEQQ